MLYFPGDDERKLRRALGSGADVVVADLEDGVAPSSRRRARSLIAQAFSSPRGSPALAVRINQLGSLDAEADAALIEELPLEAVVVPKADPRTLQGVPLGAPVIAIIETAVAVRAAYEIASLPQVVALHLGAVDLAHELRLHRLPGGGELAAIRSGLVVDSAAAKVAPPIDSVHLEVDGDAGLETEAWHARALGFGGKACIHPRQVEVVNRVFTPDKAELSWARRVVAAYEAALNEGCGAIAVEGVMVDQPVAARCRDLLRRTQETGR